MSLSPFTSARAAPGHDDLCLHLTVTTSSRAQAVELAEELRAMDPQAVEVSFASAGADGRGQWKVTMTSPPGAASPELVRGWMAQLLAGGGGPQDRSAEGPTTPRRKFARTDAAGGSMRGSGTEDASGALQMHSQRERVVASLLHQPSQGGMQRPFGRARLAR